MREMSSCLRHLEHRSLNIFERILSVQLLYYICLHTNYQIDHSVIIKTASLIKR